MNGIEIQERDIQILLTLFESRLMTLKHATLLHFNGRSEAAKKRIQKLKAAGLITERERRVRESSILRLSQLGWRVLCNGNYLSEYPKLSWSELQRRARVSEQTLRHELDVMSVKSAVCAAVTQVEQFKINTFSTWPAFYQFKVLLPSVRETGYPLLMVKPDGFLRLQKFALNGTITEHTFFLEMDRGTESQSILVKKAQCYREYYRCGSFAERHGTSRNNYKRWPFCVLVVFKGERRRNNTAESLLKLTKPILQQIWMTTLDEVTSNPLGAIWITPKVFRDVVNGNMNKLALTENVSI